MDQFKRSNIGVAIYWLEHPNRLPLANTSSHTVLPYFDSVLSYLSLTTYLVLAVTAVLPHLLSSKMIQKETNTSMPICRALIIETITFSILSGVSLIFCPYLEMNKCCSHLKIPHTSMRLTG